MDSRVVANKAKGYYRELTKAVERAAACKAQHIEERLVQVGLWNQDQTARIVLYPGYNDPLRLSFSSIGPHTQQLILMRDESTQDWPDISSSAQRADTNSIGVETYANNEEEGSAIDLPYGNGACPTGEECPGKGLG